VSVQHLLRGGIKRTLGMRAETVLERRLPDLPASLSRLDGLGLYLHIPFCRQICPYCPYNKELFHPDTAMRYVAAVQKEVDLYAPLVRDMPITSFYIGGGTPTSMLHHGLPAILEHIQRRFNVQCGMHLESHPNDLTTDNLRAIRAMGVQYLSTGVEALQDHHLRRLQRPYTAAQACQALQRAVDAGFDCVNADLIFALPGQTDAELRQSAEQLIALGVDQVAAYPLFCFPYTQVDQLWTGQRRPTLWQKRHLLAILERAFYDAGYERTSVWAFTRKGVDKYCSVTVPLYIGLGASAATYLRDVFYLNTFNVAAYVESLEHGSLPIALSLALDERMQMAGWLYWRTYETHFRKADFYARFGRRYDDVYGRATGALARCGLLEQNGDEVVLNDCGAYWLHVLQDLFSIDYVSRLWGTSRDDPWPERVVL